MLCGEVDGGSELAGEVTALLIGETALGIASDKEAGRGMLLGGSRGRKRRCRSDGVSVDSKGCQNNRIDRQSATDTPYKEHSLFRLWIDELIDEVIVHLRILGEEGRGGEGRRGRRGSDLVGRRALQRTG